MKSCPTCDRTYADNAMTFCLVDGSILSAPYEPEQTQRITPPRVTNQPTAVLPSGQSSLPEPVRRRGKPFLAYVAIGVLALLAGGIIIAWVKSGAPASTVAKSEAPSEPSNSSQGNDNLDEERAKLERERQQLALEKERQQLAEERRKLEEHKRDSTTSPPSRLPPPPSGGSWFVFLGAFPESEYGKAEARLRDVQQSGYDARIIDTDEYPNLRGGLWAVVMGPYPKSDAQAQAAKMRSVRSDVYVKSGW